MKIKELETKTGLDRASIRFYEKEGLLQPGRLDNGYREYSEQDAQLLLKIKLLRSLDVSLETIRSLQKGSADLDQVLTDQLQHLTGAIQRNKRCISVCQALQNDHVQFGTLDAPHYLELLSQAPYSPNTGGPVIRKEEISQEIHPWRRFFARMIDYCTVYALIRFVIIVICRSRPIPGNFKSVLIEIAAGALIIPLEAFMLWKFGTTPGKYVLGIRLEAYNGDNLTFREAFFRSALVYFWGVGMYIPYISLGFMVCRYCNLTGRSLRWFARYNEVQEPAEMIWDTDAEIIYNNSRSWKRGVALVLSATLFIGLTKVTAEDAIKPEHRGNELTVSQVAENYNSYLSYMDLDDTILGLMPDGTKKDPGYTIEYATNGKESNSTREFDYEYEGSCVRSVIYKNSWSNGTVLKPIREELFHLSASLLLAQEECGSKELKELLALWESNADNTNAKFNYKNIGIQWDITMVHGEFLDGYVIYDGEENYVSVRFTVTVH